MNANQFRCAVCGEVFDKDWLDAEAEAEWALMYGDAAPQDACDTVCEDCYQALPDWMKSVFS